MRCPYCGSLDDKVIESRTMANGEAIRRRRECMSCSYRFTSYERIEEKPFMVVKSDDRRQPFDRAKLEKGIERALEKRPDTGLLAGLWGFPIFDGILTEEEVKERFHTASVQPLGKAKHIFTHIEWHMTGYRVKVDEWASFFQADTGLIPAGKQDISTKYSIPSAFSNYMLYIG